MQILTHHRVPLKPQRWGLGLVVRSRGLVIRRSQQTDAAVTRKVAGTAHHAHSPVTPAPSQLYEEHFRIPFLTQTVSSQQPRLQRLVLMLWSVELRFRLLAHSVQRIREHKQPLFEKDASATVRDFGFLSDHLDELRGGFEVAQQQDGPLFPTVLGPSESLGLTNLIAALSPAPQMSESERMSITKSLRLITAAYSAAFSQFAFGLGIEHQLNSVLLALRLPATVPEHRQNLDYESLVRQGAIECILADEGLYNPEQYFFRGCHVIIESWVNTVNHTLRAILPLAQAGRWDDAAWHMLQVARMIEHAGDQYSALQSMCMVDFYGLRVLVDGLSGTGSTQVMSIKKLILRLLPPFAAKAKLVRAELTCQQVVHVDCATLEAFRLAPDQLDTLQASIQIYASPTSYSGLYRYARALESLEAAVLGGFFFKHYALVVNVIGYGIKKHAVPHLKHTYESPLFPLLNAARSLLADRVEGDMGDLKGQFVEDIIQNLKEGISVSQKAAVVTDTELTNEPLGDVKMQKRSRCPFLKRVT